MQKVINVVALLSGLVSLTVVGTTGYVYLNRESITELARERVTNSVTEAVTRALPGFVDKAMPDLPKLPSPTSGSTPPPCWISHTTEPLFLIPI